MVDHLDAISKGIGATLAITGLSFLVGAILAVPIAAAARSRFIAVRFAQRGVVDLLRAVPPVVWLFLLFYGLAEHVITLQPYPAAVFGLGLVSAAYISEIYRGGLLAVKKGQWEASQSLGLNRFQMMRHVIAPQAFLVVLPGAATWAVALLKETAVVSIIGVSDITFRATNEAQGSGEGLKIYILAAIVYILLSVPVAALARWTDRRVSRVVAR